VLYRVKSTRVIVTVHAIFFPLKRVILLLNLMYIFQSQCCWRTGDRPDY